MKQRTFPEYETPCVSNTKFESSHHILQASNRPETDPNIVDEV